MLGTSNRRKRLRMPDSRLRRCKGDARLSDKPISEALLAILNSNVANQLRGRTVAELIALRLVRQALDGNLQAIKEIADRTERRFLPARGEEPERRVLIVTNVNLPPG